MSNGIKVRKRDGSVEPLNLDKVHKMVEEACEGLGSGVSASQVEMNSGLQFYDLIETKDIQEILIRSASDDGLVSLIELFEHYPTKQVYVNGKIISKVQNNINQFVEETNKYIKIPATLLPEWLNSQ